MTRPGSVFVRSLACLAAFVVSGCDSAAPIIPQTPPANPSSSLETVAAPQPLEHASPQPGADPSLPLSSSTAAPAVDPSDELPLDLGSRSRGDDWPCFLGPTGDSKSSEKGLQTNWSARPPRVLWQKQVGSGYSIGSVSRGRYFQFDRRADKARLSCLNAETGENLWEFEYPSDFEDRYGYNNGPRCSPIVDRGRVYIFGAEGMLHCVSAAKGELLWKVDTARDFGVLENFFGVGSSPVVEGNLLLVMVGGSPQTSSERERGRIERAAGNGSAIVAFDKFTGAVRYKLSDELASYATPRLATIRGRRWCFLFARGGLLAFDPSLGKEDFFFPWRAKLVESVNASTPVVSENEVFISETYGPGSALLSVSPGQYRVLWSDQDAQREKAMQCHWNTPILVDGFLYGSSGRHESNAELRCIEWSSGKVRWSKPGLTRSSLLYVDGHFICHAEEGAVTLLKANHEKYEQVGELNLRDQSAPPGPLGLGSPPLLRPPCWAAPILSHGLLYLRGNGRIVCLELIPNT